jgi:hypothetical protein
MNGTFVRVTITAYPLKKYEGNISNRASIEDIPYGEEFVSHYFSMASRIGGESSLGMFSLPRDGNPTLVEMTVSGDSDEHVNSMWSVLHEKLRLSEEGGARK